MVLIENEYFTASQFCSFLNQYFCEEDQRVLGISIRDGCRNQFHERRRCHTSNERIAGTRVKLRFGFCDADIKAAASLHFHQHPCLWRASPHAEAGISKRSWYVTK